MSELLYLLLTIAGLGLALVALRAGLAWLYTYIVVNLLLVTILGGKVTHILGIPVTVASPLYASVFLSTDLIAEHFGPRRSITAVRLGFGAVLLFVGVSQVCLLFPALSEQTELQRSMERVFSTSMRVFIASTVAYLVSQHWDIFIFDTLKRITRGRYLWMRNNVSTISSQCIDTVLFFGIAFIGVLPGWWKVAAAGLATKVIVALIDTPFIYLSRRFVPPSAPEIEQMGMATKALH